MPILELKRRYRIEELRKLYKSALNKRSGQRLEAIYLKACGKTPPEIARLLGCAPKTVRNWIKQFNEGGPDALEYKHTGGRTAKLNQEQEKRLISYLKEGRPDGRRWTLRSLSDKIFEVYGVRLSQQQVSERVKRHGLSQLLSKSGRPKRERR